MCPFFSVNNRDGMKNIKLRCDDGSPLPIYNRSLSLIIDANPLGDLPGTNLVASIPVEVKGYNKGLQHFLLLHSNNCPCSMKKLALWKTARIYFNKLISGG